MRHFWVKIHPDKFFMIDTGQAKECAWFPDVPVVYVAKRSGSGWWHLSAWNSLVPINGCPMRFTDFDELESWLLGYIKKAESQ